MNKSLLELLEQEKKEVENIRFFKISSDNFICHAKNKEEGYNVDSCYRIASEYEEKAKESEKRLMEIRKELKKYISFLIGIKGMEDMGNDNRV